MAETPLAQKIVNAIEAAEKAVLALKELKDYLVPGKEKQDKEPPEKTD